jgi:hypothetical protein
MHACDSCMVTTKCCGVVKGVIHPFQNAPLWEYDANLPIMLFINYVVIRSRAHTHTHTFHSHPPETQCVEKRIKPFL